MSAEQKIQRARINDKYRESVTVGTITVTAWEKGSKGVEAGVLSQRKCREGDGGPVPHRQKEAIAWYLLYL